jgi:hypothetical protein
MKMRSSRFVVFALLLGTTSCAYSFRAGSFPPAHVKTIAVQPFDNETNRFELAGEVYDALLRNLPRALGVRTAGEPNYRAAAEGQAAQVLQRQVNITVAVEIVDLVENIILWESRSVIAQGQFLEASETEEVGRAEAIELLIQKIVDGAQSNW